jgi:hypothetical protein
METAIELQVIEYFCTDASELFSIYSDSTGKCNSSSFNNRLVYSTTYSLGFYYYFCD